MLIDGLFNFLNFIVSPSDQPQKFIAFVGVMLLVHVLIAVLDLKWGRGIAFTALALLAAAFYIFYAVVILQVIRQSLDAELAEPQSLASLGVVFGLFYWYLIELPILLGQGIAVVILAAVSRQRGWIMALRSPWRSPSWCPFCSRRSVTRLMPAQTSSIRIRSMRETCGYCRRNWSSWSYCSRSNSSTLPTASGASGARVGCGAGQLSATPLPSAQS